MRRSNYRGHTRCLISLMIMAPVFVGTYLAPNNIDTKHTTFPINQIFKNSLNGENDEYSPFNLFGPQKTQVFDIRDKSRERINVEGRLKWSFNTQRNIGFSPALDSNDNVYYGCWGPGSIGYLYVLRPDGTLKLNYTNLGYTTRMITSAPSLASDGTIYFSSYDGVGYVNIIALEADPERTKWKYTLDQWTETWCSPTIGADRTLYFVCSDNKLYAIDSFGQFKWSFLTEGIPYRSDVSPVIGSDGTIYLCALTYLYAINPDGTLKWKAQAYKTGQSGNFLTPAIGNDGTIYVSTPTYLYAFDSNGNLKWWRLAGGNMAIDTNGTIYITNSYLYALDPLNGAIKWGYYLASLGGSPSVGANGIIYLGTSDSNLYAFNPDGTIRWKFLTGGPIRNCPVIGNDGTIYFDSTDGNLYAVETSSLGPANSSWARTKHDNRNTGNINDYDEDNYPFPPINISAVTRENRSLLSIEYVNLLSWENNSLNDKPIAKYRIYLDDRQQQNLLAEVEGSTYKFSHKKIDKAISYYYLITAVDMAGKEGPPNVLKK